MLGSVDGAGLGGAGIAVLFGVWFAVAIGSLVMMIVALVDMARRPEWQWRIAGQERVLWILLVVLVNILAVPSLIYWLSIRKKLVAVEHAAAAGLYGPGHMSVSGWVPGPPAAHPATVPSGWHRDPSGADRWRWWNGCEWTDHTWTNPPDGARTATGPDGSTGSTA